MPDPTSSLDAQRGLTVLVRRRPIEWDVEGTIGTEPGTVSTPPRPRHNGSRMVSLRRFLTKGRSKRKLRRKQAWKRAAAERDLDHRHGGSTWRSGKGGSHIG